MPVGDQVVFKQHNLATATLSSIIQPGAGVEWLITTIGSQSAKGIEVHYAYDGVTFVAIDIYAGASVHGLQWRLTNNEALKIKNTDAGSQDVFALGVVTK